MILDEATKFLAASIKEAPTLNKIVFNAGFTGVLLSDGSAGIAHNIRSSREATETRLAGLLHQQVGRNGLEAAQNLAGLKEMGAVSVRLALINALSRPYMEDEYLKSKGYLPVMDEKTGGYEAEINEDDIVVVVGFGGWVTGIAHKAKKVYVTELEPELFSSTLIDQEGIKKGPLAVQLIAASKAAPFFKQADVVMLTGCSLVSGTMEEIFAKCEGKKVVIYGQTAAFFPEPLFRRGASVINTLRITNGPLLIDLLINSSGAVERYFGLAGEFLKIKKFKE